MLEFIPVERHENRELPVPTYWRETLSSIVDCFVDGDFQPNRKIRGVLLIAPENVSDIEETIQAYGEKLVGLPPESWETSFYQATLGGWQVFVDLYTENERPSDLVLFVFVKEEVAAFSYEVQSVHVP